MSKIYAQKIHKKRMQISSKYIKRCSVSLVLRKIKWEILKTPHVGEIKNG